MKRIDYIRTLNDDDLIKFIYINSKSFRMGMKNLRLWLEEEIDVSGKAGET